MRGPRPFRIFLMGILALTPVAQAFWFAWAWRLIGAVAWPGPRSLLQGVWVVAVLVVLAAGLELLGVRVIPRQAARPWARAVARIWLIASCLGFLAVTAVGAIEWPSRPAMAVLPAAQAARIEPARRTLFRYAIYLAGGLPICAYLQDILPCPQALLHATCRPACGVWGCWTSHARTADS
jgi:hypothetical protein